MSQASASAGSASRNPSVVDLTYQPDEYIDLTRPEEHYDEQELSERDAQEIDAFKHVKHHVQLENAITEHGFAVELQKTYEDGNQQFLRVVMITRDPNNGTISLTGNLFVRNRHVDSQPGGIHGLLPSPTNEVCVVMRVSDGAQNPSLGCCHVVWPLARVKRARNLIMTNSFGDLFRIDAASSAMERERLICRWKYVEEVNMLNKKVIAYQLHRVSEFEADFTKRVSSRLLFCNWTGKPSDDNRQNRTYADVCAGAGGSARGAQQAGFTPQFLLEWDKDACDTLRWNFPDSYVEEKDLRVFLHKFLEGTDVRDMRIDCMHISFPCQPHSLLNRGQNPEKDMIRIAMAYGTTELFLKIFRPKVLTLEQVPCIMSRRGGQHGRALISALTCMGYSVRWKVINFADFGSCQARKRLIIIASCPGQELPPFPKPTHGNRPGLKRNVTIRDVLSELPLPENITDTMRTSIRRTKAPYDANRPLATITCHGGTGNLHPSGTRTFNLQELSQLAGFPLWTQFAGTATSIRAQIGNAVPALPMRAFFNEILKSLDKTDAVHAEGNQQITDLTRDFGDQTVIDLTDD